MADESLYEAYLGGLVADAAERLVADLERHGPSMRVLVERWMTDLAVGGAPQQYFDYEAAYPIFLLPWWLAGSLRSNGDDGFLADVVYSTMSGYYYIRLLDNLMDGHATTERDILPAAGFFHMQFQSAYAAHFPADHGFWAIFRREWTACAEATILDHGLDSVDRQTFLDVSARKMRAGFIPVAAVCLRYGRSDLLDPWRAYCDLLARCVQMTDDVFDWHDDLGHQSATYFLTEASRRTRPGESVPSWVVREGFGWGVETVRGWLGELRTLSDALECRPALEYVDRRLADLRAREVALSGGHAGLARIASAFEGPT